ncbi:MAG: [FeFe] hydrogenase, group A [Candidatus Pacebacteria bacterium]|nr:[FeFe] hydrogenase, group A [Candidatus Paceibacterota bacterium]
MKKINITIDGKKIIADEGQTILEVAAENGIQIPSLCYHPDLSVKANCRICIVSVKGLTSPQTACSTKVQKGMEITTESPEIAKLRKINLELIFSQHKEECADCVWNFNCQLLELSKKYKLQITRFSDRKSGFPIYNFGPALQFDSSKCIDCRNCVEVCHKQQVGHLQIVSKNNLQEIIPNDKNPCIFCGQCIIHCPAGAFEGVGEFEEIETPLADKNKVVVFQFAPAIRTTIGEEFNLPPGEDLTGQIVAGLKQLGANYVFDVSCGADFTTLEEATESLERIRKNENLPLFSSCCPAWVRFIEVYYPQLIPHLTTARSPHVILGSILKSYWATKYQIDPVNLVVVSIMPCVAKKYEITRDELRIHPTESIAANAPTLFGEADRIPPVDYVLTTRELAKLFKKHKIDLTKIDPTPADDPFGNYSGAGVIYGASGGVMESALRTAFSLVSGGQKIQIEFQEVRGQKGLKTAQVDLNGKKIKVAVANGLENAVKIIQGLNKEYKDYACIEVMACPGGCIGGGGQPLPTNASVRKARAEGLYKIDEKKELKMAHENPALKKVHEEFLTTEEIKQKICHTYYSAKNN